MSKLLPPGLHPSFRDRLPEGHWPLFVRSPGRINLIGEHLDYNGGLVLPAAIDRALYFAMRPVDGHHVHVHALDIGQQATFDPDQNQPCGPAWLDFVRGICQQFQQSGYAIPAMEIAFGGNLPIGSGMSSSAALEGGMAFLLNVCTSAGMDRPRLAKLCQQSSNEFLGIPSGIMDQFASLNGQPQQAILLDCATLDYRYIAADLPGYSWLLINSGVTHALGQSEYATRVRECRQGLTILQDHFAQLRHLAHTTKEQLAQVSELLPTDVLKRCLYVVREQARVVSATKALRDQEVHIMGQLLNDSHAGLRDDYQVSCPEIDYLQSMAQAHSDVAGARLMGGGFGGCTLNLVKTEAVDTFGREIQAAYRDHFGQAAELYSVHLSAGTELVH